jgi:hypothetical protein
VGIRARVIGTPEFSTDGWHPYKSSIRDAFGNRAPHGTVVKTYSVIPRREVKGTAPAQGDTPGPHFLGYAAGRRTRSPTKLSERVSFLKTQE